jgi:hypothetical protein
MPPGGTLQSAWIVNIDLEPPQLLISKRPDELPVALSVEIEIHDPDNFHIEPGASPQIANGLPDAIDDGRAAIAL